MKAFLVVHLMGTVGSLVIFSVSFSIGLLYLIQEGKLKNHQPVPSWLRSLPALEVMDRVHYKFLSWGFVLLSVGMLTGSLLSQRLVGKLLTSDPRQIGSIVCWFIYALFLSVRVQARWRGRRGILLSLLGFAAVVLLFFGIEHQGM